MLALVAALGGAACGRGGSDQGGSGQGGSELTVFAAASLTRALDSGARYSFAGSQQLVAQIEGGARPDVVVTADETTMGRLAAAGLVEAPRVVATNSLAIVVPRGNPAGIRGLADLARAGLTVVLADPSVPAGRYASQALVRAGVSVQPASLELDVEAAVQKVALGEADAAIAYRTDAAAEGVELVDIPAAHNVTARYPAAVLESSGRKDAANRFIDALPDRLQRAGFGPPPT